MNIPVAIARIRLKYHMNMLDVYNSLNQLHLVSDEKADNANRDHFKKCIDCFTRLGFKLPKEFNDFARD